MARLWTKEEVDLLKSNVPCNFEIAKIISRTPTAVGQKAQREKLYHRRHRTPFSEMEDVYLISTMKEEGCLTCAAITLSRTPYAVERRMKDLRKKYALAVDICSEKPLSLATIGMRPTGVMDASGPCATFLNDFDRKPRVIDESAAEPVVEKNPAPVVQTQAPLIEPEEREFISKVMAQDDIPFDEYEALNTPPATPPQIRTLTVGLPVEWWKTLKHIAIDMDLSDEEVVVHALQTMIREGDHAAF